MSASVLDRVLKAAAEPVTEPEPEPVIEPKPESVTKPEPVIEPRKIKTGYTPDEALVLLNERYALIETLGMIVRLDGQRVDYMRPTAFQTMHNNQSVTFEVDDKPKSIPMGTFWLKHPKRRTYTAVGFYPPPLETAVKRELNLWRGFAIEPQAGDWSRIRAHIREVIADGNSEAGDYVEKWIAYMLQNPGLPAGVAVALRGAPGAGKGFLGQLLRKITAPHSTHITSIENLLGRFSGHTEQTVFLFLDECLWSGNKQAEQRLRGLLTEPTRLIERKGLTAYETSNCLHLLIASNEDWVAPIQKGDRRYVVLDVSNKRCGDHGYFRALHAEANNGGAAAMVAELSTRTLGDWTPESGLIMTAAKREQQLRSLSAEHRWLFRLLEGGQLPGYQAKKPHTATTADLRADARSSDIGAVKRLSDQNISAALKQIGAKSRRVGTQRGWGFPPLAECRRQWNAANGVNYPWGPESEDWT